MPYRSRWKIEIPQCTLPTFLFESPASPLPDKPTLIDAERPDRYYLTYHKYRLWSQRFAAGLIAAGLRPGEPVLLYSGNTLFFPVVLLGVVMAGGVFTAANPGYTAREVAYQLSDSGARFLICACGNLGTGLMAAKETGLSKDKVFIFDQGYDTFDGKGVGKDGCKHWSALIAGPEEGRRFSWKEGKAILNDTVALNYSSGTTGLPKGVEITHTNYVSNAIQHTHLTSLRKNYETEKSNLRWLCILPMYHALAQTVFGICGPYKRIPIYIMHKFDFTKMLESIQRFRITDLQLVPPVVVAMAKSPLVRNYDLSSVIAAGSGAAPLGSEVTREFERLWPPGVINVKQGYGLTEGTCSLLGWDPKERSGSYGVGEPNANVEVKLVDPSTLQEVARGERGELWARGPNIMKGYWKKPQATIETLTKDGWLRTGDVAVVDEKGTFFIVDRIKELIKVKGHQVAPAELEAQLLEHPGIADAAVIGVTINGSEVPRAYVVVQQVDLTPDDVVKYMDSKVSRHKRLLGGVKFVDSVIKNPSGKILRRAYREQAAKEIQDSGGRGARL